MKAANKGVPFASWFS